MDPAVRQRGAQRLPYAEFVRLTVRLRRYGYRAAHLGLRIWWFVANPHLTGVKCVLTDGDNVLLVRHTYGQPKWDLPGGSTKRGEHPRATARREMAEELGVELDGWSDLGTLSGWVDHRHDTVHCFQAELLADRRLTLNLGEIEQVRWFPRDRLPLDRARYVTRLVALAAPERSAQ